MVVQVDRRVDGLRRGRGRRRQRGRRGERRVAPDRGRAPADRDPHRRAHGARPRASGSPATSARSTEHGDRDPRRPGPVGVVPPRARDRGRDGADRRKPDADRDLRGEQHPRGGDADRARASRGSGSPATSRSWLSTTCSGWRWSSRRSRRSASPWRTWRAAPPSWCSAGCATGRRGGRARSSSAPSSSSAGRSRRSARGPGLRRLPRGERSPSASTWARPAPGPSRSTSGRRRRRHDGRLPSAHAPAALDRAGPGEWWRRDAGGPRRGRGRTAGRPGRGGRDRADRVRCTARCSSTRRPR